ncbi:hypothetical protein pb186bvf_011543 [Paramecium bursaria]
MDHEYSSHFYVGSNISHRDFNQSSFTLNSVSISVQNTNHITSSQYQGPQNEQIYHQSSQPVEEQIKQELNFEEYKKNFLPIFLLGYKLYLKKKKTQIVTNCQSLYTKVDNLFKQLKIEGNARQKYGIKLIKILEKSKVLNFNSTVNDYRRTYAPLYFMKKVPVDVGRKDKLIQYIETLKMPFPSGILKAHLQKKHIKIKKAINKDKDKDQDENNDKDLEENNYKGKKKLQYNKNIYRKLMRETRRIINKQDANYYTLNLKGLYDFYNSFKGEFIADKKNELVDTINKTLNSETNKNQENKIKKFLNYVESQNNQ